jgi:hypothetical protein
MNREYEEHKSHEDRIAEYEYYIKEQEEQAYSILCDNIREMVNLIESTVISLRYLK